MVVSNIERKKHTLMSVCTLYVPYIREIRFPRIISKMPEVLGKMKHAHKTINQCAVTAFYRV